ncbi:hypothetical protein [Krasilnikovia sp. MM14-A1004]|uniref:hypothetical protein n=1 Tax=Krasilnikovia sp. MM14-A1004 TaxID=3373541 RepID=UPI00399C6BC2
MALNKKIAAQLAEDRLVEWRHRRYDEWRAMIDESELRQVVAEDGKSYSVSSFALDDGDGRIRMCVAVDDAGWSSFAPLSRDEIINPDGTFVP